MKQIQDIALKEAVDTAISQTNELLKDRVVRFVKQLVQQEMSLSLKYERFLNEARKAEAARDQLRAKIEKIKNGDWSVVSIDQDPLSTEKKTDK